MAFEDRLEAVGLKRPGDHSERARGRGGSGGRTHAAMLYSLGLYFSSFESPEGDEEVHLTLAGQALVSQEDALPVLRRQVLAHQFPSAYSVGINIDRRFALRPFVLLLRLLGDPALGGYLTDREIAACVITYGDRHTRRGAQSVIERILAFRRDDINSLEESFAEKFLQTPNSDIAKALAGSSAKLNDVANTAVQWLRYTGYAEAVDGSEFGASEKTVTSLNLNLKPEIDKAVEEWAARPLEVMNENTDSKLSQAKAAAAFQRSYGRTPGAQRDNRKIGQLRSISESSRTSAQVAASFVHLKSTDVVLRVDDQLVFQVVNHSGLPERTVRRELNSLISTAEAGLDQFLDRYQQMAFSSRNEAIAFEKATANVLREVFNLDARQLGQTGRVPDVEVWSGDWRGIIDTKAYSAYALESDHQLRMQTSYVPPYVEDGAGLDFFLYIAGGFAPSFETNLRKVIRATGVAGSGIGILALSRLIARFPSSGISHDDLRRLWSLGREVTLSDVEDLLAGRTLREAEIAGIGTSSIRHYQQVTQAIELDVDVATDSSAMHDDSGTAKRRR